MGCCEVHGLRPPLCFLGEHSWGLQVWAQSRAARIQILTLPVSHEASVSPSVKWG